MEWRKGRLSRNSGRLLLLALPLIAMLGGGVVYRYGYLRVRAELSDIEEAQAQKIQILQKQVTLISKKSQLEQEQRALWEARRAEGTKFIDGTTAAMAAASMQQMVKGVITGKGGAVLAENVERPEDAAGFTIISETLDSSYPDIKAFLDTICALETQAPCLSIREVDVRVKNSTDPRDLAVRLRISALTTVKFASTMRATASNRFNPFAWRAM